jgi:cold shock CspA family protein
MSSTSANNERLTGMVKWFNNKAGFGFLTACGEGQYSGKDIFVHYSNIRVTNSQYKFLVLGEYVEFVVVKSDNEKHEYHATDITGILGGPIMCETRRLALAAQSDRKSIHYNNSASAASSNTLDEPEPELETRKVPEVRKVSEETRKPAAKRTYKPRKTAASAIA